MRLNKKDKIKFYVSYFLAENNGKKYYSDSLETNGVFCKKSGSVVTEDNGKKIDYSATIVLEFKDANIPININSVLWINKLPTDKIGYNYVVRYKSEIKDNLFTLYVDRLDTDFQEIWYDHDGIILPFKLNYDYETKVGIVPIDTFIPFNKETRIWENEPFDLTDENGLIELQDYRIDNNLLLLKFNLYE